MLQSSEQYCLAWESKYLMELGNALDTLLNGFVNMMAQEALKFTVLSGKGLNHIRSARVALAQFHCWCLFKGVAEILCHTYSLDLLSCPAVPLCH